MCDAMMKLDQWLEANAMTEADFAERIGVSQPTISRIRRGVCKPSLDTIAKIEDYTKNKVTVDDFLGEPGSR